MIHITHAEIRHFLDMRVSMDSNEPQGRTDTESGGKSSMTRFFLRIKFAVSIIATLGQSENNSTLLIHSLVKRLTNMLSIVLSWFGFGWESDTANWMWAQ